MHAIRRLLLGMAFLAAATEAGAQAREDQVVLDWNVTALQVAPPGNATVRAMPMVHVAMFDAVNAIDPRYRPYLSLPPVTAAVDARAAAAAAAYGVLVRLHPTQQLALDLALTASLASIPDGPEETAGLALGNDVAVAMTDRRAGDNFFLPNPVYVPGTGPAAYQRTPPAFANPLNQNAPLFVPFVMAHSGQFRPNGPPRLSSRRFANDYDEVRTLGVACPDSTVCARTPEQTAIASWHNTEQGHRQLSRIARILTLQGPADILETARNFALLGLAMGDGFVSAFEAIYAYRFVRPVTAIRAGDADGVPGTAGDPAWTPQLVTPPFPEYPSIRAVASAAGAQVIKKAFGRHTSFDTTAPAVPGITRHFEDIDAFVADGQLAEIYQGIHFRSAVVAGRKQGKKVGKHVLQGALRPLGHDDGCDDDDDDDDN